MMRRYARKLFLCVLASIFAVDARDVDAQTPLKIDEPIRSVEGTPIDIEALRLRIRNIDEHLEDRSLSNIISTQLIVRRMSPDLVDACESRGAFPVYAMEERPTDAGREAMVNCAEDVLKYMDNRFESLTPGYYKRFSNIYIDKIVDLGIRCGYHTKNLFSYLSAASWIFYVEELSGERRFRCLGDVPLGYENSTSTHEIGIELIVSEPLFYFFVFGNWIDIRRYSQYKFIVSENNRYDGCIYIYETEEFDENLKRQLLKDNKCSEPSSHGRRRSADQGRQ